MDRQARERVQGAEEAVKTNAMTVHMRQVAPEEVRWSLTCEGCGETWDDDADSGDVLNVVRSQGTPPGTRIPSVRPKGRTSNGLTSAGFWMHGHFFECEGRK